MAKGSALEQLQKLEKAHAEAVAKIKGDAVKELVTQFEGNLARVKDDLDELVDIGTSDDLRPLYKALRDLLPDAKAGSGGGSGGKPKAAMGGQASVDKATALLKAAKGEPIHIRKLNGMLVDAGLGKINVAMMRVVDGVKITGKAPQNSLAIGK